MSIDSAPSAPRVTIETSDARPTPTLSPQGPPPLGESIPPLGADDDLGFFDRWDIDPRSFLTSAAVHLALLVTLALCARQIVMAPALEMAGSGGQSQLSATAVLHDDDGPLDAGPLDGTSKTAPADAPPQDSPPAGEGRDDDRPSAAGLASLTEVSAHPGSTEDPLAFDAGPVNFSEFGAILRGKPPKGKSPSGIATEEEGGEGAGGAGGFASRMSAESRAKRVASDGGTPQSEQAVNDALVWLAEHQNYDGSWSYRHGDAPHCRNQCDNPGLMADAKFAATGMALLPFLGAGQTHKQGKFSRNVDAGLKYLIRTMKVENNMGAMWDTQGRMYGHGLATIALCEDYGMTQDSQMRIHAQRAITFIVHAQDHEGGGWRYSPQEAGDTSVVGWQLMALKSGHLAGLAVPQLTIRKADYFLDFVQSEDGAAYGYTNSGNRPATSAIGLLCRMYMGWKHDNPALRQGVEALSQMGPSTLQAGPLGAGMYYNYYATQVMHQYGGPMWDAWNKVMRDRLVNLQSKIGHEKGSWFFPADDMGSLAGGRLYCTAMSTMVLEVYYRHMPLYTDENAKKDFFH